MVRAEDIQEQLRTKAIEILSGFLIKFSESRAPAARAVTHKWWNRGAAVNLPDQADRTRTQRPPIQEVTTTSNELKVSLASVKVGVCDSTRREMLVQIGLHSQELQDKNHS